MCGNSFGSAAAAAAFPVVLGIASVSSRGVWAVFTGNGGGVKPRIASRCSGGKNGATGSIRSQIGPPPKGSLTCQSSGERLVVSSYDKRNVSVYNDDLGWKTTK